MRSLVTLAATAVVAALLSPTAATAAPHGSGGKVALGGGPTATVTLDDAGSLHLSVGHHGRTVLDPGPLGITTTEADFSSGVRVTGRSDRTVTEKYRTKVGKSRERHVRMAEARFALRSASGSRAVLTVRAADDGIAYRFELPDDDGDGTTVTGETSGYRPASGAAAWLSPYTPQYERPYAQTTASGAAAGTYAYPALFRADGGDYVMISESGVDGRYDASHLEHDRDGYELRLADDRVRDEGALATPWRTVTTGDLATVAESTLTDDLAPSSRVADTSWIEPGVVAWSWLDGGHETQRSLAAQKRYVDMAAANGWKYALVDDGWKDTDWMPELVSYARERGVRILLWMHYEDVDTEAERQTQLNRMNEWGVAGLKIDFMESDSQARFKWYDDILRETAAHHLLVNFHGSTIPHGIQRTWPQVMSMEAVYGAEQGDVSAESTAILPFTRNVVGSMDYTPMGFQFGTRPGTEAAELATSVVFESGFQDFAGSPAAYDERPEVLRFLKQVPTTWDETELLTGDPGKEATFARRNGDRWFVGSLGTGAAGIRRLSLGFLGKGRWRAEITEDGADGLVRDEREVDRRSVIDVPVRGRGGYVVALTRVR
ncbi:glycoside hydrolase family 97 catalytic domain-containing protein [Streptomyces sp. NPDC059740]|uniref:glycoside hydrolase family 97 protein n=1 Tax=Streptomyces sp. NPDC059740 TaxID=3346926 RepID=UPI003648CE40